MKNQKFDQGSRQWLARFLLVIAIIFSSNLEKARSAYVAQNMYGYSKEDMENNKNIRDRILIYRIKDEATLFFEGLGIFPNDEMEQIKIYIDEVIRKFYNFYTNFDIPDDFSSRFVAGPTGVAKSMVIDFISMLLIKHELFLKENYIYRQGHENRDGIDLSPVERFKVTKEQKEEFDRLSLKLKNDEGTAKDYDDLKDIFLTMMGIIVIDEASHVPSPKYSSAEEAVQKVTEAHLQGIKSIESKQDERIQVEEPVLPSRTSFTRDEDGKKEWEEAVKRYRKELFQFYTRGSDADVDLLQELELEIADELHNEIKRLIVRDQQEYYKEMFWQALSFGKISLTTFQGVDEKYRKDLTSTQKILVQLRAMNLTLFQGAEESEHYIKTQIEKRVDYEANKDASIEKIASISEMEALYNDSNLQNELKKLTQEQFEQWFNFVRKDLVAAGVKIRQQDFRNGFFDTVKLSDQMIFFSKLINDLIERPGLFKITQSDIAAGIKLDGDIAGEVDGDTGYDKATNNLAWQALKTYADHTSGERQEGTKMLHDMFGSSSLDTLIDQVMHSAGRQKEYHQEVIKNEHKRMETVDLREDAFNEDAARRRAEGKPDIETIAHEYYVNLRAYEEVIRDAIRNDPAVHARIRAMFKEMIDEAPTTYSNYWKQITQISQKENAREFFKEIIDNNDPIVMYQHIKAMEHGEGKQTTVYDMVEDVILNGTNITEEYHIFASMFFLLNVKEIEAKVLARIREGGKKMSYDLYRRYYIEEFQRDGRQMTDEDLKEMDGTHTAQSLKEEEEEKKRQKSFRWNWVTDFLTKHMPGLIENENWMATLRRFGRAIFLLPPDNKRVANLIGGRILVDFNRFLQGLPPQYKDVKMALFFQEDVAKYFVPKNIDAQFGVAQTLDEVSRELKKIFNHIETGLGLGRIPTNPEREDRVKVVLTLEESKTTKGKFEIAVRFLPHDFPKKDVHDVPETGGFLTAEEIMDLEFPSESRIEAITAPMNGNQAFVANPDGDEPERLSAEERQHLLEHGDVDEQKRALRRHSELIALTKEVLDKKENDNNNVSYAAEQMEKETQEEHARVAEEKYSEKLDEGRSRLVEYKNELADLELRQEILDMSEHWFDFMWPPRVVWYKPRTWSERWTRKKARGRTNKHNEKHSHDQIPPWFYNLWKNKDTRNLIRHKKITRKNYRAFIEGKRGINKANPKKNISRRDGRFFKEISEAEVPTFKNPIIARDVSAELVNRFIDGYSHVRDDATLDAQERYEKRIADLKDEIKAYEEALQISSHGSSGSPYESDSVGDDCGKLLDALEGLEDL